MFIDGQVVFVLLEAGALSKALMQAPERGSERYAKTGEMPLFFASASLDGLSSFIFREVLSRNLFWVGNHFGDLGGWGMTKDKFCHDKRIKCIADTGA